MGEPVLSGDDMKGEPVRPGSRCARWQSARHAPSDARASSPHHAAVARLEAAPRIPDPSLPPMVWARAAAWAPAHRQSVRVAQMSVLTPKKQEDREALLPRTSSRFHPDDQIRSPVRRRQPSALAGKPRGLVVLSTAYNRIHAFRRSCLGTHGKGSWLTTMLLMLWLLSVLDF